MWRRNKGRRPNDLITAQELACFAYCPEQWRLQHGLGLTPENRAALDAGIKHHDGKTIIERLAGGLILLGRWLAVLVMVVLLLLVIFR